MKICHRTEIGGIPIILAQHGRDSFRVTYWREVKDRLTYGQAATAYGVAVMHALACAGLLDNREKGEE